MALDNAQFISELSITDPPGTDAVAEGDDHIRTVKRATQQSFPNVDAAVPQTAAQMGQMAIKNEVNTFTQANIFTSDGQRFTNNNHVSKSADEVEAGWNFRDSAGTTRWALRIGLSSDVQPFRLDRFSGAGAFLDSPISVDNSGFIVFDTAVVDFPDLACRINASSGSNDSGINFIGGVSTLRWSLIHKSDVASNSFELQRYDSNGTFLNVPIRVAGNGNIVFERNNQRLSFLDDASVEKIQMGLLTNQEAFMQGRSAAGVVSFIFRADAVNASSYVNAGSLTGARFGVGTSSPQRTLHVAGPSGLLTSFRVTGLPTSSAGLTTGDVFNSGGFLAIV